MDAGAAVDAAYRERPIVSTLLFLAIAVAALGVGLGGAWFLVTLKIKREERAFQEMEREWEMLMKGRR